MTDPPAARRRQQLLCRIHRRYQTITETLGLAGNISFTRVADPNRVLDDVAREEDRREKVTGVRLAEPPHLPYWAELWDSAMAVAQTLLRMPLTLATRVMDLGCGMGLAGTVAAARGAQVLFADLEAPALLFARLNSLDFAGRVRTRRIDWRVDRLHERFDYILGADIVYDRNQWDYLEEFCAAHLARDGTILLAEPNRQSGEDFITRARNHGWQIHQTQQPVPSRIGRIRMLHLSRPVSCAPMSVSSERI